MGHALAHPLVALVAVHMAQSELSLLPGGRRQPPPRPPRHFSIQRAQDKPMAISKTFMKPASLRMHAADSDAHSSKRRKSSSSNGGSGQHQQQQPHSRTRSLLLLSHHGGVAHIGAIAHHSHPQHACGQARAPIKLLIQKGLSREAAELKQRIRATCPDTVSRFSFSCMKRLVTPPVSIPPYLASARATTAVVSGKSVPMTRAMWTKSKARLQRRLPGRIDEQSWR